MLLESLTITLSKIFLKHFEVKLPAVLRLTWRIAIGI